ncbi:DUF6339 family protein [Staphylococcus simulans]|uniref:DUF6339 family protein n=1 Tax=Staphylococcus simulans TaxID=1286 RepID=UPI000E685D37|nr:DUF6339 family protein [Staphylococcus simulans]RIN55580.1 hypothetical protein BU029_02050 [Staphylococcus simulans]
MINWENINFDIGNASKSFDNLEVKSDGIVPIELPSDDFKNIRKQLISARDEIFDEYNYDGANKLDYQFDLLFGLKLYDILNNNNFKTRDAMNDDVWRYLSIKVVPDIVHSRWELNEAHFYKMSRRIWLKTLWWYIHLSYHNDLETTYELLKNNSTDTIMNLVERPGIGYNINLYREIMRQYNKYNDSSRNLFRRVLKVNTARIVTTSPELVSGGIERYVDDLFKDAE